MPRKPVTDEKKQRAFSLLTKWFNSTGNDWGSKGYLVARLSSEVDISKNDAAALHKEWASNQSK